MLLLFWVSVSLWTTSIDAGVILIGTLTPSSQQGVTTGFSGIAFDGTPGALVLDRWSWEIKRVSLQNAAVLSTSTSTPVPAQQYNAQLAFDSSTGNFYTVTLNTSLVRINAGTLVNTQVGSSLGAFYNFVGLSADGAGNLWLATDHNSVEELSTVDKQSGFAIGQKIITAPTGDQVTALLIDGAGRFIVAMRHSTGPITFNLLNTATGATTVLTQGSTNAITAMAYDPMTQNYYGIENGVRLVQIVGVPESTSIALLAIGIFGLLLKWRGLPLKNSRPFLPLQCEA